MTYQQIKSFINTYIVQNGVNAITGAQLNTILNELADYKGFDAVVVTTLPAGSDATATVQGMTLVLGIPKGADGIDGIDGQNAVNPFKGWFTTDNIPTTGQAGDYCNVSDTSVTPHTVTIYRWNTTTNQFEDTGEVPDTATGETFASGETLQEVAIDDSHLENPVNTADPTKPVLAQAKDVKEKILDVMASELRNFNYNGSEDWLQNVANFFVDKNGVLFALLMNDGSFVPLVKNADQKRIDNLLERVSSDSIYNDPDVLKYFVDDNNICFAQLKKDGKLYIEKAFIKQIEVGNEIPQKTLENRLSSAIGLIIALSDIDSIELSNNPRSFWGRIEKLLTTNKVIINNENDNKIGLKPVLSIIDDDTCDYQIPSSEGRTTIDPDYQLAGGYFSVLLPIMLSLSAKYGKNLPVGLACEGRRVGLTTWRDGNDTHDALNTNGRACKWLAENMGWDILNHSMTAQLPGSTSSRVYSFCVDNFTAELQTTILASAYYTGVPYSFENTRVFDRATKKWYEVRTNNGQKYWYEFNETEKKKYAQLLMHDYPQNTGGWHYNRDFDFGYSWGEWYSRAEALGLPTRRMIVHNGGTASPFTVAAGRKFAYCSVRIQGTFNNPPIGATINREDGDTSATKYNHTSNVKNEIWHDTQIINIDDCILKKAWMVFMTHFNTNYFRNRYYEGTTYPEGVNDYPEDWIIPLNKQEIEDLINGVQDYVTTPPSRLSINSWDEWHPAPGTHVADFYNILDYALSKGVEIVAPWSEWLNRGNILNMGVEKGQGQDYPSSDPLTVDESSCLTVGANMEIIYNNGKSNN